MFATHSQEYIQPRCRVQGESWGLWDAERLAVEDTLQNQCS